MDLAALIGISLGVIVVVYSIVAGGFAEIYFHISSILVTVGGGIASTLVSYRLKEIGQIMRVTAQAFSRKEINLQETIRLLVSLSQKREGKGLFALESEQENIEDGFIKRSLQLIVDGGAGNDKRIIDLELDNMALRHEKVRN